MSGGGLGSTSATASSEGIGRAPIKPDCNLRVVVSRRGFVGLVLDWDWDALVF